MGKLDNEKRYQRAKALLEEAGYNAQNPLKFSLLYNTSDQNKQQAIVAASMWKKILSRGKFTKSRMEDVVTESP